jgi:hypothetical protein
VGQPSSGAEGDRIMEAMRPASQVMGPVLKLLSDAANKQLSPPEQEGLTDALAGALSDAAPDRPRWYRVDKRYKRNKQTKAAQGQLKAAIGPATLAPTEDEQAGVKNWRGELENELKKIARKITILCGTLWSGNGNWRTGQPRFALLSRIELRPTRPCASLLPDSTGRRSTQHASYL